MHSIAIKDDQNIGWYRTQWVRRVLFILKCEFSEKDKNGSWESAD